MGWGHLSWQMLMESDLQPMGENQDIASRFSNVNVWRKGGVRAPHKPLLVLLALGEYSRGGKRLVPYRAVDEQLRELLMDFGPVRQSYHPELPFWHLQTDGLWELATEDGGKPAFGTAFPGRKAFMDQNLAGGFPRELHAAVSDNPELIGRIAASVLSAHFPDSMHEDILQAVGLGALCAKSVNRRRDPRFREIVLRAYGYECAICGFKALLDRTVVGIEAAHIKWHQAGGPDDAVNGVALCSLHHKLFDRGMLTISSAHKVQVSERAHGSGLFRHLVLAFDGQEIHPPTRAEYEPRDSYLKWHVKEVFQGEPRYGACSPA